MNDGINCPECGCHIELKWKTDKEIKEEDCCNMDTNQGEDRE